MYRVTTNPLGSAHTGYHVYGPDGYVDTLRTQSGADHAARMLNSGCCVVDEQRPVGCRVTPNPTPSVWDERNTVERLSYGTIGSL